MNVHNNFSSTDGREYSFRRLSPNDSCAGMPGVFVFLRLKDFAFELVHVEASSDLGCVDQNNIQSLPVYEQAHRFGFSAVGVYVTVKSGCGERIANEIREFHGLTSAPFSAA